jgi:hypothetical protein
MNIQGKSLDSHVLISSLTSEDFAIAYLDFSRGPETELWLYSSLERGEATKNESKCEEQIIGVLKRVAEIILLFPTHSGDNLHVAIANPPIP